MFKVENLKSKLGSVLEDEFIELARRIYYITDFTCADYPKHKSWYFEKHLPELINGTKREILYIEDQEQIIAIACLKKDEEEKKICTLYISDSYRDQGLGTTIIEESMRWLETTKPLITIADYKLGMFTPIINKYDWQLTEVVAGMYNDRHQELCYNGSLTKDQSTNIQKKISK